MCRVFFVCSGSLAFCIHKRPPRHMLPNPRGPNPTGSVSCLEIGARSPGRAPQTRALSRCTGLEGSMLCAGRCLRLKTVFLVYDVLRYARGSSQVHHIILKYWPGPTRLHDPRGFISRGALYLFKGVCLVRCRWDGDLGDYSLWYGPEAP